MSLHPDIRRALRTVAVAALACLALVATTASASAGVAASSDGDTAAEAAHHDRLAQRYERLARREARRIRAALRSLRRARARVRSGRAAGVHRRKARRYRRAVRMHRRRRAQYLELARWHRAEARRLRRQTGTPGPIAAGARRAPIPLGAAIDWGALQSDWRLDQTFRDDFDQMTAENEMKMWALEPSPGRFDFEKADEMVDWARAAGKRVRGHTLIWGNQNPQWLEDWSSGPELLKVMMRNYIQTVMQHFKGQVTEWDVVNEAIAPDAGYQENNPWYRVLGPDYVRLAFEYAREADPTAKLYYNDAGIELPDHPHTQRVLELARDLRSAGLLDGVGIQNHVTVMHNASEDQLAETMQRFADLDLDVAITEMDVRTDGSGTRAEQLDAQRRLYEGAARACRRQPRCTSLTTWGVSDRYSWWQRADLAPLLFDEEFQPKPAYAPVKDWIQTP